MGSRENKVEKHLKKQIKLRGGESYKWVSPGMSGVPDQICIVQGHIWFVEVKTVDGLLSPVQQRQIKRLLKVDARVWVVSGHAEVNLLMEEVDRVIQS
jgi:Holliday junction resolvase